MYHPLFTIQEGGPPDRDPPTENPRTETPLTEAPQTETRRLWTKWHTDVKTLPCSKLCLRAVIIPKRSIRINSQRLPSSSAALHGNSQRLGKTSFESPDLVTWNYDVGSVRLTEQKQPLLTKKLPSGYKWFKTLILENRSSGKQDDRRAEDENG